MCIRHFQGILRERGIERDLELDLDVLSDFLSQFHKEALEIKDISCLSKRQLTMVCQLFVYQYQRQDQKKSVLYTLVESIAMVYIDGIRQSHVVCRLKENLKKDVGITHEKKIVRNDPIRLIIY